MVEPSTSIHFVRAVLRHAPRHGLDVDRLLIGSRIAPGLLAEDQARVSAECFINLQRNVQIAMDDESLGYAPRPFHVGTWALMCHAVIGSGDLGRALARFTRFYRLFDNGLQPRCLDRGNGLTTLQLLPFDDRWHYETYLWEMMLFSTHQFMCWLAAERLPMREVAFHYAEPVHAPEYAQLFMGEPCGFERGFTGLSFATSLLEKPVKQTEQSLVRYLRHPVRVMLAENYAQTNWSTRVRRLLRRNVAAMPAFEEVARTLAIHPQSLRRRLADEGVSFSELRLRLRRDLAVYYLGRQGMSIEEIAPLVGFSEASAFIRAFKGWFGVTPHVYRSGL